LRLTQEILIREVERAAVEDGLAALEKISAQLAYVPIPTGLTPRELNAGGGRELPVIPVISAPRNFPERHDQESKASG